MEGFPKLAKPEALEEAVDEGLGVLVKKKTLYHGSATEGIQAFNAAEEDTIGNGVYLTSEMKDAVGYAERRSRSKEESSPIVYEAVIENMKMLDLRKEDNVQKILSGFRNVLEDKFEEAYNEPDSPEKVRKVQLYSRMLKKLSNGTIHAGNLREITFNVGNAFTQYVRSLKYEGIIAIEGGEGSDIGNHDSYVVFNPASARISQALKVE